MTQKFSGLIPALATPFTADGKVDYTSYMRLLDHVAEHVDGVVVLGTTGQTPTLTVPERMKLVDETVSYFRGSDKPVIAGVGSNNTDEVIVEARRVQLLGADGFLIVAPPYNKPDEDDLAAHYWKITNTPDLEKEIVVYNVPGRTGVNILPDTMLKIADMPLVKAIKEASGNMAQISTLLASLPGGIDLMLGDDILTIPGMAIGATGTISVAGQVFPAEMKEMITYAQNGDYENAKRMNKDLIPVYNTMFITTNPKPVNYALHELGIFETPNMRLPLTPLQDKYRGTVKETMNQYRMKQERLVSR